MLVRALAILSALVFVSLSLSWAFGAEVLMALGLIFGQLKIVIGKLTAVSLKTLMIWLKAQGLNFARVELAKRWFLKSLLPLVIGAATQRRIAAFLKELAERFRARSAAMMDWYRDLPRAVRVLTILIAMAGMLALAVTSMSLWLLIFSVQVPIWIMAAFGAVGTMVWQTVQKMLFRTIAFMQLHRIWGVVKRRLPESYLQRKRKFDYRLARIVVRRRRLTVAQLHQQKDGLAMRWALIREYFRHVRPMPTQEEMDDMERTRNSRKT